MTTETEIDPRLVCLACGWDVDDDGRVRELAEGLSTPLDVEVCDGAAYMSAVLEALGTDHVKVIVEWEYHGDWMAQRDESDDLDGVTTAYAPTPHEAVFALATKIGRSMESNR